jgi:hypothetical protein
MMLTAVLSTAVAQDAPQKYSTLTIEVKPGMNAQFEEFISKYKAAAEQTNSPYRWTVAQSVSGNPVYSFTRPFQSFAALSDARPDLNKAFGAAEGARLLGLLQASVEGESSAIYVARPDLSRPRPEPGIQGTPEAVLFVDITVKSGKEEAFEGYAKKIVEASNAKATDQYWQIRQRMFGPGQLPVYRVVVVFAKWTELDRPGMPMSERLKQQFGAAEAERLEAIANDSIQGVNERLNRVRADLARPPT